MTAATEIAVETSSDHVAVVEIRRPPHNYFDAPLIESLADTYDELAAGTDVRVIVLASQGRHFCAGADLVGTSAAEPVFTGRGPLALYAAASRLFTAPLPVVAAVQGAAIGGGLGLALSADFRVATAKSRFVANFTRIGLHHGFGLTVTLPTVVGRQKALDMLYTGRQVTGEEAFGIGLADRLATVDGLRAAAVEFAAEIAAAAPLAVRSVRATMWADLVPAIRAATEREAAEQAVLHTTADFTEGIQANAERREPRFTGR